MVKNGTQISYWINIIGIKKINQLQIHNGTTGQNDAVLVTLSKGNVMGDNDHSIGLVGNVTKDDLQEILRGKEISDLVILMNTTNTYLNVQTDKFPNGEIRGEIVSGLSDMEKMWTNETTQE